MFISRNYDYLSIGSSGFAQFGTDTYYIKAKIECAILMPYIKKTHPIPEEFKDICSYSWKRNPYEGDSYYDVAIYYNCEWVESWADSDDPELNAKHDRFWEWANQAECIDLEVPELIERMNELYADYEEATKEVKPKKSLAYDKV